MMKNKVLVRNGKHMRPMLYVLERYGIGQKDQYNRGLWIRKSDLSIIKEKMTEDKSVIKIQNEIFVRGTNMHNHVSFRDFEELFK